jgi:Zn-dependent metalloprotease
VRSYPARFGVPRIWLFQAVRDPRVTEGTKFADFAAVTIDVAKRLPDSKKAEVNAVADAWAQVGVSVTS